MPNMHLKVIEYDQKIYEYSHCVLTVPIFEYDLAAAIDICLSITRPLERQPIRKGRIGDACVEVSGLTLEIPLAVSHLFSLLIRWKYVQAWPVAAAPTVLLNDLRWVTVIKDQLEVGGRFW